jgi:allantoate deiminase
MSVRAEKIETRILELAAISDEKGIISRMFGTKAFVEGRDKVATWMKAAGLTTSVDNIGNVRGRFISTNINAKTLVIASHIDTVVNAGKFDGPLGVIMGLDIVEHFISTHTNIPFHIELIAFSDEEGVRFHSTFLGSRVVAGSFDQSLLTKKDRDGISLQQAVRNMGGDESNLLTDAIPRSAWLGYFEIHIEQGPVLYDENIPVAVVSAIAGQQRAEIIFTGVAGHAGTVPMDKRKDALACAAEFILVIEKFAKTKNIVATVGKLNVTNAASNVIPGEVMITLDVRSQDESLLQNSYDTIREKAIEISASRSITMKWNHIQNTKPVLCDARLNELLRKSIQDTGHKVMELASGAGHDAVAISEVSPVSMLFVRCFKGISHNPLENVERKDLEAAIQVADRFLINLAEQN